MYCRIFLKYVLNVLCITTTYTHRKKVSWLVGHTSRAHSRDHLEWKGALQTIHLLHKIINLSTRVLQQWTKNKFSTEMNYCQLQHFQLNQNFAVFQWTFPANVLHFVSYPATTLILHSTICCLVSGLLLAYKLDFMQHQTGTSDRLQSGGHACHVTGTPLPVHLIWNFLFK